MSNKQYRHIESKMLKKIYHIDINQKKVQLTILIPNKAIFRAQKITIEGPYMVMSLSVTVNAGSVCDQNTSKFFVSSREESITGHKGNL
jgi:hypothetical protein